MAILLFALGLCASAQKSDGFFNSYDNNSNNRYTDGGVVLPNLPEYGGGDQSAEEAPLGTGIFLLTAFGAGYAISKRRKEER